MGAWTTAKRRACGSLRALAVCLTVLMGSQTAQAQRDSLEYPVKATYLYKFGPFVEWPDAAFASPSSSVNLCVVGDDPFGGILDRAVAGQQIGERSIVVRRVRTLERDSGCHIAYIAGSDAQSVEEALNAARGTHALTVTDAASDAEAKGIIHFVVQDNRVRFEIDDRAAAENRIAISSKLLNLALSVRPRASSNSRMIAASKWPNSGS